MNNSRNHQNGNSLPPARTGGTATAVQRSPSPNGNGNGNGTQHSPQAPANRHPSPAAAEALHWDALAPRVTEALGQPLDPQLVSQRKGRGGRKFDYIEGHTAIDQANRIFGFGGWGFELVGDVTLRQIEQTDSRSGEVTRTAAYSAVVRVTVPGAPSRTDVGFQPVTDDSPEGHETAFKGAVTDGLKRALRSFGDRFGNGLYGDPPTSTRSNGSPESAPPPRSQPAADRNSAQQPRRRVVNQPPAADDHERDAATLRAQLIELSSQQGFSEQRVRQAVQDKTGRALDQLGPAELNRFVASAAEKLERRQQAQLD